MAESHDPAPDETTGCQMCHQQVPLRHTMTTGGRVLCFGCLMGAFEDDDAHEADE